MGEKPKIFTGGNFFFTGKKTLVISLYFCILAILHTGSQGAKSELKNLAVVDVHQIRLTNFYFA